MVTIREVASAAGVSIATVSRSLISPDRVADDTRERVLTAARDLGYSPNRAASGLRAGRTNAIGLVVPDLTNPYFAAVARGVAAHARRHGLAVFVADSEENPESELDIVHELVRQTDGLVLCSPRADHAELLAVGDHPVVVLNQEIPGTQSLAVDDLAGARLALEHLHGLGHRRVGYVGGPVGSWSDARRRQGLAVASNLDGLELIAFGAHAATMEGGESAAGEVIAARVSAVVVFSDMVAIGLIRRLQRMGLQVPRDLSAVSFDNTFLTEVVTPSLTSVHGDLGQLGRRAAELLLRLLPGDGTAGAAPVGPPVLLPARMAVRDSTTVRHDPRSSQPGGQQ